ncbi:MAG: hypothetical protein IJ867_02435 [Clostridia bacterium]|nr:hypothetical protein [Clostridia bacterium]
MDDTKQFKKNFLWNILGTGFNAFNSLFFMITVTRLNGLNHAGIFTIAYSTACIIYVIGIYAGRIYQVTELDKKIVNKDYIVNRLITVVLMNILVVIFALIRGYDSYKILIFFLLTLYKSMEAFSEVIYGILQKNEKLEFVGKSLLMKSLLSLIVFIIVDIITKNMAISIATIIIVWILVLVCFDFRKAREYLDWSEQWKLENVLKIFKNGFTTFAIAFLGLYIINAPKYSIDSYLPEDVQTIFGIIVMPATVIGLVAQFLIHPFLNQILKFYEERDLKKLNQILLKLIGIILGFGIVAAIAAYLLGTQVLGLVYGLDLSSYKIGLLIIIIASTLYTIGTVYSSVLTTVRETFSQFVIYIIIAIFALIISNVLTKIWNLNGAIFAYLAIMAFQFLSYTIYTNVKLKGIFKREKVNE